MSDIKDTLDVQRAAPTPTSISAPFWEATREKKLILQYDPWAGKFQYFPRAVSRFSGRRQLEWREVSGAGEVHSFTIARRGRPPFAGHEPYFIAVVTLKEGVNVMGNMVNCDEAKMRIGLKVKPHWAPLPDGTHLLMFEPDE